MRVQSGEQFQVVVVGAGVAGLAVAATLGRCKRRVAVIGERHRANSEAVAVHNLPYADGISASDLYSAMEKELSGYGVPLVQDEVRTARAGEVPGSIAVETSSYIAHCERLVIGHGLTYEIPAWVPAGAWGKYFVTCPFCHGYEHDGQSFVVVGRGQGALKLALMCAVYARTVTVILSDSEAAASPLADKVRAIPGQVICDSVAGSSVRTDGTVEIATSGGREYEAGLVIVAEILRLPTSLTTQLGLRMNSAGIPETDEQGRSSDPRIWVIGTAAHPHYMLAESIGSGIRTAVAIHSEIAVLGS